MASDPDIKFYFSFCALRVLDKAAALRLGAAGGMRAVGTTRPGTRLGAEGRITSTPSARQAPRSPRWHEGWSSPRLSLILPLIAVIINRMLRLT